MDGKRKIYTCTCTFSLLIVDSQCMELWYHDKKYDKSDINAHKHVASIFCDRNLRDFKHIWFSSIIFVINCTNEQLLALTLLNRFTIF